MSLRQALSPFHQHMVSGMVIDRSTAMGTVGCAASSSDVQRQADGVTSMTRLRPRLSDSPPRIGLRTNPSTPEAEATIDCARACAAGSCA